MHQKSNSTNPEINKGLDIIHNIHIYIYRELIGDNKSHLADSANPGILSFALALAFAIALSIEAPQLDLPEVRQRFRRSRISQPPTVVIDNNDECWLEVDLDTL